MSAEADPLQALVHDSRKVNRAHLAGLLKGKVLLDPKAASFVLLDEEADHRRSARQAVLISLLAVMAMYLLNDKLPDYLTPKQIGVATGLKGNTVRPILGRLLREGFVLRKREGYTINSGTLATRASSLLSQPE